MVLDDRIFAADFETTASSPRQGFTRSRNTGEGA